MICLLRIGFLFVELEYFASFVCSLAFAFFSVGTSWIKSAPSALPFRNGKSCDSHVFLTQLHWPTYNCTRILNAGV